MPLYIYTEKCRDEHELKGPQFTAGEFPGYAPIVQVMVLVAMTTGLYELTEKNVDEWIFRMKVMSDTGMRFMHRRGENADKLPDHPTRQETERLIGFRTNVSSLSRAEFKKNVWRHLEGEALAYVRTSKEPPVVASVSLAPALATEATAHG
jgi:hypothetical protein